MHTAVRYCFRQDFAVSAEAAFGWCIDYTPQDHALMGNSGAQRQIRVITESTLIIIDTFSTRQGPVEKQKLVDLYPESLSWSATHLTGPNKYSQFQYKITPDGDNASHLDFIGLQLFCDKDLSAEEIGQLAESLRKEDSKTWQLLAQAMAKDLA